MPHPDVFQHTGLWDSIDLSQKAKALATFVNNVFVAHSVPYSDARIPVGNARAEALHYASYGWLNEMRGRLKYAGLPPEALDEIEAAITLIYG